MHLADYHFLPHEPWFFFVLALLFAALVGLVELGVLTYIYDKMGINRRYVFLLLFLSLLGCYINIPIARLHSQQVRQGIVTYMGRRYVVPVALPAHDTMLAVNVGGAVIPTLLSLYLLIKNSLYARAVVGVIVVTAVVHFLAQPVAGIGIKVPIFVPPLIAATVALALSRDHAAPLAYIAGTLGTLIGADLMNVGVLASLGPPVASIGGAGTFDGVFLTGIIAVLLA